MHESKLHGYNRTTWIHHDDSGQVPGVLAGGIFGFQLRRLSRANDVRKTTSETEGT